MMSKSLSKSAQSEWFQTWDRSEYLEWAKPISEGYLLHIIKKETYHYLVVQAKLMMKEVGLPDFHIMDQINLITLEESTEQINKWRNQSHCKIEKLFSYGTLQYEAVQLSTFGRKLIGSEDNLSGFKKTSIQIKDSAVISKSGTANHPILVYTGNPIDKIQGVVFDISENELKQADEYEVSDYKRVNVTLDSGIVAWVYINNQN